MKREDIEIREHTSYTVYWHCHTCKEEMSEFVTHEIQRDMWIATLLESEYQLCKTCFHAEMDAKEDTDVDDAK